MKKSADAYPHLHEFCYQYNLIRLHEKRKIEEMHRHWNFLNSEASAALNRLTRANFKSISTTVSEKTDRDTLLWFNLNSTFFWKSYFQVRRANERSNRSDD